MMPLSDDLEVEQFEGPCRLLVTGDTHFGPRRRWLPRELTDAACGADLILHLGDFCTADSYRLFQGLGPLIAVVGNNDDDELQQILPSRRLLDIAGFRVGVLHGHGIRRLTARKAAEHVFGESTDLVIFGHSHRSLIEQVGSSIYLNPGSSTDKRWEPQYSFATIDFGVSIEPRLHYYDRQTRPDA